MKKLMDSVKTNFKIFDTTPNLHYFDHAATTFMPKCVMDAWISYHELIGVSSNRTGGFLGEQGNISLREGRMQISEFFSATEAYQLVFTKNATESLNILANGLSSDIQSGDVIIVSELEHHSALLPWMKIAKENGAILIKIPLMQSGNLDYSILETIKNLPVKVIASTYISNVTGSTVDVELLKKYSKSFNAKFILDISQAVSSHQLNLSKINADAYALSAHKMYGPKNIGGLFIKNDLIQQMPPLLLGGGMVWSTSGKTPTWADGVQRFEAGTFDIGLILAWREACRFLKEITYNRIQSHNNCLYNIIKNKVDTLKNFERIPSGKTSCETIMAIKHKHLHAHDLEQAFSNQGIILRSGHMCSQPTVSAFGESSVVRLSWGLCIDQFNLNHLLKTLETLDKEEVIL